MTEDEVRALLDVIAWDSDAPANDRSSWGEEPGALLSRLSLGDVRRLYGCPVQLQVRA